MNNNTYLSLLAKLILIVCALISLHLTYEFTTSLAAASGASIAVFAAIGLALDLTKTVSPLMAARVIGKSQGTALALGALTVSLIAISGLASYSALESGIESANQNSREYKSIESQIVALQTEISGLNELAALQQDANQLTRSDATRKTISDKNSELSALLNSQLSVSGDNIVTQFGVQISLSIAALLEIVSLVMVATIASLSPQPKNEPCMTAQGSATLDDDSASPLTGKGVATFSACNAREKPSYQPATLSHAKGDEVVMVAKTSAGLVQEQIKADLKVAIVSGVVEPKIKHVAANFGLPQRKSSALLKELFEDGVLESFRNGYRLKTC
ncbi:hypothetical protein ACPV5R_18645 [Vibrio astriarenae]